jgi:hypothetical protein
MAQLLNQPGTLRFVLSLGAIETAAPTPRGDPASCDVPAIPDVPEPRRLGLPILSQGTSSENRVLATAGVEYLDRSDREFWPYVRFGVLWLGSGDPDGLIEGLSRLVRDEVPGFLFRSSGLGELGLQISKLPGSGPVAADTYGVEVGLDLGPLLTEAAGGAHAPGEALSLFRYTTGRPQLVAFAQSFREELQTLKSQRKGGA